MKRLLLTAALLFPLAAAGCIIVDADNSSMRYSTSEGTLMRVYSAEIGADEISLRVPSNGCTEKSFFNAEIEEDDEAYEVGFFRIRDDFCKALVPDGVMLTWSMTELGLPAGARVELENAVGR